MLTKKSLHLTVWATLLVALNISNVSASSQLQKYLMKAADTKESGKYVRTRFLKTAKKPFQNNGKKKALIIGDSHAQDFFNTIVENGYLTEYQLSTRSIPTRCQVYLGDNLDDYIAKKDQVFCAEADTLTKAKAQIAEADLIILASNWKEWSATELPTTIKNMQLSDKQKLIVIGRKSFGKVSIRKYLRLSEDKLKSLRNNPDSRQDKISSILQNSLDKDTLVDLQGLVCESGNTSCPIFTDDLKLITFDGGHLTQDGARYIGKILFTKSQLSKL